MSLQANQDSHQHLLVLAQHHRNLGGVALPVRDQPGERALYNTLGEVTRAKGEARGQDAMQCSSLFAENAKDWLQRQAACQADMAGADKLMMAHGCGP